MSLSDEIARHPYWYHRINLGNGFTTPGWAPIDPESYRTPADLTGKRVLDCGSWDGYWAFEAVKRGARYVLAIDDFSDSLGPKNVDRKAAWQTFDLCRDALGISPKVCERIEMSIYHVSQLHREFDHIFCFGVLYHLRHPLFALEQLKSICVGGISIETAILDGLQFQNHCYDGTEMAFEFFPGKEFGSNDSNWWAGTLRGWSSMVDSAGFKVNDSWKLKDAPRNLSECRGFISATC